MKKMFLALAAAVVFLCGCQTADVQVEVAPGTIDAEKKVGEDMLKAYRDNDAKAFLALLPVEVKERFGEAEFRTTRNQVSEAMGTVDKVEYLTCLNAPGFRSHLWKVTFKRTKVMDPSKELKQETLFRVVLTTPDKGSPYILSFGFL